MAIFKCKMCGGELDIQENETVATCDYCGTKQTVPTSQDEDIRGLFNRANILRMKSEFDKSEQLYEKILLKDDKQSEAYWGVLLCKFGIEYVEDPKTDKRIPTCHRASFEAFTADEYYKLAIENADSVQREIYEKEAKYIDKIQKEILAISQEEEPYDVFICYKETGADGNRTQDSVIANDIYYQLTQEGYKVFYAAITLEDKLGTAYEPVIFAALNSARVMLAIGTKPEYFNAVWVKNEWARYLKLMKTDRTKILIPCYKDMDAYELPEEFAHLQAQDMGKIGFINDIVRGIKKVIAKPATQTEKKSSGAVNEVTANVTSLLKRAFMFAEDGDFVNADAYAEKVLDNDPECAEAYLVKLMCDLKVKTRVGLESVSKSFEDNANYKKAIKFGDDKLKQELENCVKAQRYNYAKELIGKGTEEDIRNAKKVLESIPDYKNSNELISKCDGWAEEARKNVVYLKAKSFIVKNDESQLNCAKELLFSIPGYRDVDELLKQFDELIEAAKQAELQHKQDFQIAKERVKIFKGMISVGYFHIAAVKSDGTALAVGDNRDNQCNVFDWQDVVAISAGDYHTVGLKSDGSVVAVGDNKNEQCNVSSWKGIVAIEAGFETFGLKSNGTVVVASKFQTRVSGWKDVVAIAAGFHHTVGLKSDGTVIAAGKNDYRQCNVSDWKDIVAIAAGRNHTVGLKSDGTVRAVGENDFGQCDVYQWKDIVSIAAGTSHTVGLKSDGTVVVAKKDIGIQRHVLEWKDVVSIAARHFYTVGLKSDGTVVAVGLNDDEQSKISEWKLFENVDSLIKAREDSRKAADEKKRKTEEQRIIKAEKLAKLQKEKAALISELHGLGLFAFARKKEIKERIAKIDNEISKLK